jgi:hypothetical protein
MTMRSDTDPGDKSASQLEREVEQQRADVERTLDAIQDRLSPGQLVDQTMNYLRDGGGGEFVRNLGDSVKHNPMPVALIGVGIAWMMASSGRRNGQPGRDHWIEDDFDEFDETEELDAYEATAYGEPVPSYGAASGTVSSGLEEAGSGPATPASGAWNSTTDEHKPGLSDRAKATAASAREKADELRQRARDAAHDARTRAGDLSDEARAAMARAGRGVSDRARRTRDSAGRYGRRAQRGFLNTLHEQPLVLGAIGLAVGAALGSALPSTEREDRLMGDTRDRLKRRAVDAGREQMDKASAAAGAAYDAARDEAERQGLTPEDGRSAVEAARQKVERVAEAASSAGKEEAERQGVGKTGPGSTTTG